MTVRAVRGAIQVDRDEEIHLLDSVRTLLKRVMHVNGLLPDDLISVVFTATPDLTSGFPAAAARELGLVDVPLMCAQELDAEGALPRTVRVLAHVETGRARRDIRHVCLVVPRRQDLAPTEKGGVSP